MDFGNIRRGGREALPEEFVRKPWQSFSTMKRFLSEAVRLENASWRIWFMQQRAKTTTRSRLELSIDTRDENDASEPVEERTCVYCELAHATLTCNGCCHDPYCVSCFKLIHMRGHLASHTAVKIHQDPYQPPQERIPTPVTTPTTRPPRVPKPSPMKLPGKPTKSWEEKMDVLFQKLMVTSMHHDGDISVHNIDSSPADPNWTADKAKVCGNCKGPHMTIACPLLGHPPPAIPALPVVPEVQATSATPVPAKPKVCGSCSGDHITLDCPRFVSPTSKPTICGNCHGNHATLLCPALAPPTPKAMVCGNCRGEHITVLCPSLAPAAPPASTKKTCANCGGNHITVLCPSIGPSAPVNIPSPPSRRKTAKAIVCGNCRGDHMTISCPQLQEESPKHVVDSIVRKCFTSYHNANTSNSTHAYLGDEVSVHGAAFAARPPPVLPRAFAPIQELPVEVEASPVLPALAPLANQRTADVWILSSLWNEMPAPFLQRRGHCSARCSTNCLKELRGWVYLKPPHCSKWRRRYMVLYRNQLTEFLDESDAKPIGFANLHEASVVAIGGAGTDAQLKLSATTTALCNDGVSTCMWCFDTPSSYEQAPALVQASRLQIRDLFGDDDMELGKGRFAKVTRAERQQLARCSHECAIKIIDKAAFWDLVAQGVERNDTLFREVLTQSVLTLQGATVPHHGYVVTLLSLFETHDHLVMEMELMAGGDIYDHIVTHGPLQEAQAALVMTHLIRSIQFCLENGIAHRDVKISNLALDVQTTIGSTERPCVLKLADFGMGAFLQPNGMLLGRCGTPGYVAPEILTAGVQEPYPPHVDMFSAGVVLYTLLCGYEPFYAINDKELILLNKAVTYFFHPEEWAHISHDAKDLITRMLTKDPADRIRPDEALAHPFLKHVVAVAPREDATSCTKLF
ncbi:calcium/calmodulin-dependent protein kinase [Achlya hypogyna]|uniref:Calcium/calmodulin-dependent protein kinase n=1 Tax=Achlya hypogyna TaxID=1202772 RepID=A0A1V9ZNI1_ACHHY|nr:calcium/calmodulin-dependent protein kinase [Achlya hypogyna]